MKKTFIQNLVRKGLISGLSIAMSFSAIAEVKIDSSQVKLDLMEKLKGITHFNAKFQQTVSDVEGNVLQIGAGSITVSKPDKVHWQTSSPEESLIVSDGETLWLYDPFIEQASAYKLNDSVANTPILLLTSEDKAIWSKYHIESLAKEQYRILSIDEQSPVKSLDVTFSGQEITQLVILDSTGQKSVISLQERNYYTVPKSELFNFVMPAGTYLDDQR